jgi:hypothetical protein
VPDSERSVSSNWFTSPLLLAIVGLIGTGVGAVLQGFWNTRLEREKFEFSLIEKALATRDKNEAALNLKFLVDAGLISQFNSEKIASLASNPKALPNFSPILNSISVRDAKAVLSHLGIYKGPIDDSSDDAFRKAVVDFQQSHNLPADGMIGPLTSAYMRAAWPEHFASP